MPPRQALAVLQQSPEKGLIQRRRLLLIDPGQGRTGDRLGAEVVELVALAFQVRLDIPQALPTGELRHGHADELIPARRRAQLLAVMVLPRQPLKVMSGQGLEQLVKRGVMM